MAEGLSVRRGAVGPAVEDVLMNVGDYARVIAGPYRGRPVTVVRWNDRPGWALVWSVRTERLHRVRLDELEPYRPENLFARVSRRVRKCLVRLHHVFG